MPEVLLAFDEPIRDEDGAYHVRVIGRFASDGMWEGWLEFEPLDDEGGKALVGPVESRQPQREHLAYWATGLTPVFLEGALHRAKRPVVVTARVVERPLSIAPAPRAAAERHVETAPAAILDPFEVGRRNMNVLDQELRALNRPRLLDIIASYDLNPAREDLSWMTDAQLVRFIVVATEAQLGLGAR
jgi:hypothetical protein